MTRTLVMALVVVVVQVSAQAQAPEAFARLRNRAQQVDSLGAFLEHYVGSCTDLEEKATCQANVKKVRAEQTGRLFYINLDDTAARMLTPAGFNASTNDYQINLTPFFETGGLALTDGAPIGQDPQGRPRMPLMRFTAHLPREWIPMDMERVLRTQNVRVHLVFRPLGVWSLPSGKGKVEGVKAKFVGVQLVHARSGEEIAVRTAEP